MLTLKLCADSATSRRSVDPATLSFAKLSALAAESFPGREVAHYTFQDDEGDTVTILGDADLREAIRIAPTLKPPTLRQMETNHRVFMFDQEKVTLDPLDDKRHALENGLHTLAHGHCRIGSGCVDGFGR